MLSLIDARTKYDKESDVLYISLGKARPAYVKEDNELPCLNIRYDIETGEIVGATVVDYSFVNKNMLRQKLPFNVDLPN
jgi:uncharacterized protein YuzE